jgi:hypothetical protein
LLQRDQGGTDQVALTEKTRAQMNNPTDQKAVLSAKNPQCCKNNTLFGLPPAYDVASLGEALLGLLRLHEV